MFLYKRYDYKILDFICYFAEKLLSDLTSVAQANNPFIVICQYGAAYSGLIHSSNENC